MPISRVTINGWRQETGTTSRVTINGWRQETAALLGKIVQLMKQAVNRASTY